MVAFTFVLGRVERALRGSKRYQNGTINDDGKFVPDPAQPDSEWTKLLKNTVYVLNRLMDQMEDEL